MNIEDMALSIRLRVLSRGIKLLDRGAFEEELRDEDYSETLLLNLPEELLRCLQKP